MSSDDEQQLITAAQQGDAQAFAKLLEHCYDRLFRFAYRWCGNTADAEDVTQLACLKLAQNVKQFRFEAAFSSWLYRLVINCAKDWQRSQQRHRHEALDVIDEETHQDKRAETGIYLQQILHWLDSLAEGFKETALLVHAEGLTHAEAAAILQIKESTVSWRLHEIRKQLHQWQQHDGSWEVSL
jgi:RNA polymerase sigma factor (sigma-70 family)